MNRRELLRSSALLGAVLAGGGGMRRTLAETQDAGYGPLAPVADDETGLPLLKLPEGFRYRSLSWTTDAMTDGMPTPDLHDGMGVLADPGDPDTFVLMRNHERAFAMPFGAEALPRYDTYAGPERFPGVGGGTTALTFSRGQYVETLPTLGGTLVNCAGGITPWGSWFTCEEVVIAGREPSGAKNHGYVFEVPAPWLGKASARPIVAMGRMKHEAVGIDPRTGFAYLTEDNGPSGLYRFRPRSSAREVGAFEQGGSLEMLKVRGVDGADMSAPRVGDEHAVEWVAIANPDAPPENLDTPRGNTSFATGSGRSGPFLQGRMLGGAEFRRLEGVFVAGSLVRNQLD
jgi:secreted PhoX family phosphatase